MRLSVCHSVCVMGTDGRNYYCHRVSHTLVLWLNESGKGRGLTIRYTGMGKLRLQPAGACFKLGYTGRMTLSLGITLQSIL